MSRRFLAALGAAALAATTVPALAHGPAGPAGVSIRFQSFDPSQLTVLAGDEVTWTNTSAREHTVTQRDGAFDSGSLGPARTFKHGFAATGLYRYVCKLHPSMTGQVDVRALLLRGPRSSVARGAPTALEGRTTPGPQAVTIEEDRGSGFRATSTVDVVDGKFHTVVRPTATTTYRATAGSEVSAPVVVVVERPIALTARLRRRTARLTVRALPPQPGTTVVLQFYLRERFGWWPVARRRLDRFSSARFTIPRGRRVRVVLTEPDGATVRGVSNVLRIRRARR